MDKGIILKLRKTFEDYAKEAEGVEFWFARDLQKLLGYDRWENFFNVIEKAKIACKNSGQNANDHFPDVKKMVDIGSDTKREIQDIMLTRYACYLIAQNGDPRKEEIALKLYPLKYILKTIDRRQPPGSGLYTIKPFLF